MEEFREKTKPTIYTNNKTNKWLQLFCMYLANYTDIKQLDEVQEQDVQAYFDYLTTNHKRLSLSLADIKRSMQLLEESLNIKIYAPLLDFSLSNSALWKNLK